MSSNTSTGPASPGSAKRSIDQVFIFPENSPAIRRCLTRDPTFNSPAAVKRSFGEAFPSDDMSPHPKRVCSGVASVASPGSPSPHKNHATVAGDSASISPTLFTSDSAIAWAKEFGRKYAVSKSTTPSKDTTTSANDSEEQLVASTPVAVPVTTTTSGQDPEKQFLPTVPIVSVDESTNTSGKADQKLALAVPATGVSNGTCTHAVDNPEENTAPKDTIPTPEQTMVPRKRRITPVCPFKIDDSDSDEDEKPSGNQAPSPRDTRGLVDYLESGFSSPMPTKRNMELDEKKIASICNWIDWINSSYEPTENGPVGTPSHLVSDAEENETSHNASTFDASNTLVPTEEEEEMEEAPASLPLPPSVTAPTAADSNDDPVLVKDEHHEATGLPTLPPLTKSSSACSMPDAREYMSSFNTFAYVSNDAPAYFKKEDDEDMDLSALPSFATTSTFSKDAHVVAQEKDDEKMEDQPCDTPFAVSNEVPVVIKGEDDEEMVLWAIPPYTTTSAVPNEAPVIFKEKDDEDMVLSALTPSDTTPAVNELESRPASLVEMSAWPATEKTVPLSTHATFPSKDFVRIDVDDDDGYDIATFDRHGATSTIEVTDYELPSPAAISTGTMPAVEHDIFSLPSDSHATTSSITVVQSDSHKSSDTIDATSQSAKDAVASLRAQIKTLLDAIKSATSDGNLDMETQLMIREEMKSIPQFCDLEQQTQPSAPQNRTQSRSSHSEGASKDINPLAPSSRATVGDAPTPPTVQPKSLELWDKELALIRMDTPFIDMRGHEVSTVDVAHRTSDKPQHTANVIPSQSRQVISLDSDDEDHKPDPSRQIISLDSDDEDHKPDPSRVGGAGLREAQGGLGEHSNSGSYDNPIIADESVDGSEFQDGAKDGESRQLASTFGFDYRESGEEGFPRQFSTFYGIHPSRVNAQSTTRLLRYQHPRAFQVHLPSPITSLDLDLDKYRTDTTGVARGEHEKKITDFLKQSSWGEPISDDGKAISENFTKSKGTWARKGFPLVEQVTFLIAGNYKKPSGDCYWRAVSLSLYGSDEHWTLVKAEHLAYLYHVLSQPDHPRTQLYWQLNRKFFDTSATGLPTFKANIWQILHMPHSWTPGIMQQITADLYNIHIVTFAYKKDTVHEVSARGVYNSRHIFLLFKDNNHFQPMIPNEYIPWEFRYPRITVEVTAKYRFAPRATSKKTTVQHPWRNEFTQEVMPPVGRAHGAHVGALRQWMTFE
ncbi:hypothetical protein F4778DRAFT_793870 [Xylariomycetidae sp. FL2044]|nr:hypothetical protein F4778DRAFT_793870 [Xylariomycetidae sp. FL2044]